MRPGGALPSNRLHLLQSRRSSICHVSAEEANGMLCPPGSQLTRRYMTLLLIFFFPSAFSYFSSVPSRGFESTSTRWRRRCGDNKRLRVPVWCLVHCGRQVGSLVSQPCALPCNLLLFFFYSKVPEMSVTLRHFGRREHFFRQGYICAS